MMLGVMEEENDLLKALTNQDYTKAHTLLRNEELKLEGNLAERCLMAALHTTPNLFRKVLSRCASGEYIGQMRLELTDQVTVWLNADMLCLAAAMDLPEHVKALLEAGYDSNAAGIRTVNPSEWCFFDYPEASPYGDRSGNANNQIIFFGKAGWRIRYATPLAAAVACGSMHAASVLLRREEVWKAESGVVCRAAVSALQVFQNDPRQAVAGMVFGKTRGKAFDAEKLVRTCDLQVEHSIDFCSHTLLQTQLEQGFCDEAGARIILKRLGENHTNVREKVRARISKLDLISKHFSELCREPWVSGIVLREVIQNYRREKPYQRLLERWKALCGEEADLSWAARELALLPLARFRTLLQQLEEGMSLVVDADALDLFRKDRKPQLMELLRRAKLRFSQGLEGVSALTANLTTMADLRYLHKAGKLGAFAGENPSALLEHLNQQGRNDLRSLILYYGGKDDVEEAPVIWQSADERVFRCRSWKPSAEEYQQWVQQMMDEELSEEECLRRLRVMQYPGSWTELWWTRNCTLRLTLTEHSHRSTVRVNQPEAALCCGTQTQPLRLMMEVLPSNMDQRYPMEVEEAYLLDLMGTPLTLAAATGRTELVQLLLDSGIHPDEQGRGVHSTLTRFGSPLMPVTPIMAAIYYGEEEAAKQLLEAGAECDFSKPLFRMLLERGNGRTREVASRLPGVGYEELSPQWLESLEGRIWF